MGFDSTTIEIDHSEPNAGESGYTFSGLVRVALDGMFFRSTVLLRVVVLVRFLIATAGFAPAAFEVIDYFVEPDKTFAGYACLAVLVLVLVLAGFIIISVGVVGLYVGRVFEQVKDLAAVLIDDEASGLEPA